RAEKWANAFSGVALTSLSGSGLGEGVSGPSIRWLRVRVPSSSLHISRIAERSAHLFVGPPQVGPHAGDAVGGSGGANALVASQLRDVVGLHGAVEAEGAQVAHHPVHVQVAVIGERFDEVGERGAHVAEVDVGDFAPAAEVADHVEAILAP